MGNNAQIKSKFSINGKRFISYFGNTDDFFADNTLYPISFEWTLSRSLIADGYERVIFYRSDKGAYCYDDNSINLWNGRIEEDDDPFADDPLFNSVVLWDEENNPPKRIYRVSASGMLRNTETFVTDSTIKTAVVIADGTTSLKNFYDLDNGNALNILLNNVSSVRTMDQLLNNESVLIFVFQGNKEALSKDYPELNDIWSKIFKTEISSEHYVDLPCAPEIRNTLNYLRIYGHKNKTLNVDCRDLDKICKMLERKLRFNVSLSGEAFLKIVNTQELAATSLKKLILSLVNQYSDGKVFDLEECRKVCQKTDDRPAIERLNELIGMQKAKDEILSFLKVNNLKKLRNKNDDSKFKSRIDLLKEPSVGKEDKFNVHFALMGNPGTGKTTIARLIGEILFEAGILSVGHTVAVKASELKGDYNSTTEEKTAQHIRNAMGGVLFVDEAYQLAEDNNQAALTMITAAMSEHDGEFAVVFAGYEDKIMEMITSNKGNVGLERRFANKIHLDDYTSAELTDIFRFMAKKDEIKIDESLDKCLPVFIKNYYYSKRKSEGWGNAGEMEALLSTLKKNYCSYDPLTIGIDSVPDEFKELAVEKKKENPIEELNSFVGQKKAKDKIKEIIKKIEKDPRKRNRHFIFKGPPGVGKTAFARLMGNILSSAGVLDNGELHEYMANDMVKGYVGQTGIHVNELFKAAYDDVIFIDEAYQLNPNGLYPNDFGGAVINCILKHTDPSFKDKICVICAGYSESMEGFLNTNQGLRRRFDIIEFDCYTPGELTEILMQIIKKDGNSADEGYFEAAKEHFTEYYDEISKHHNAAYVNNFYQTSVEIYCERTTEDVENPITLTAEDVPAVFLG